MTTDATADAGRRLAFMADGPGSENPFENLPMFGDLARALSGQGPLNWDAARQFAGLAASAAAPPRPTSTRPSASSSANWPRSPRCTCAISPGSTDRHPRSLPVTSGAWAQRTLEAYRPLFTELATSLGQPADTVRRRSRRSQRRSDDGDDGQPQQDDGAGDDGHGRRLDGRDEWPRRRSASTTCRSRVSDASHLGAAGEHRRFADGVEHRRRRDAAVGARPGAHRPRTVLDHVAARGLRLARAPARRCVPPRSRSRSPRSSTRSTPTTADPMQAMQQAFGDPAVLLGAVQSPEQRELEPSLDAAAAAVVGYVDCMVDGVAVRVIGGDALRIAEAVRRRRVDDSAEDCLHRAAARPAPHPRSGAARQELRRRRRRSSRRGAAQRASRPSEGLADPGRDRRAWSVGGPPRTGRRARRLAGRPASRSRSSR